MYSTIVVAAFVALLHIASASVLSLHLMKREWLGNNVTIYLQDMCFPNVSNETRMEGINPSDIFSSLAYSPYPCELYNYFLSACGANGTTPIDFIAEQQCLCNGGIFWDLMTGCNECYLVHGDPRNSSSARSSYVASLKTAECSVSQPCQPFSMLLPPKPSPANGTSFSDPWPNLTLGDDRFPNDTAVSNYWTPTRSITLGEITGSATARLTSFTNVGGVSYVPTCTNTPNTSASGNLAAMPVAEVQVVKVVLAVVLGAAVLL